MSKGSDQVWCANRRTSQGADTISREAFEAWKKLDSTLPIDRDGEGYADMDVYIQWRAWQAAQADAYERAAMACEAISDEYQRREGMRYPEMKTDAETGAEDCATAIRALAKEVGK